MVDVSSKTLGLISRIYDGGLSSGEWPVILDELVNHQGAMGAAFFYHDSRQPDLEQIARCWSSSWQTEAGDKYLANVTDEEPSARLLKKRKPREIMTSENISIKERLSIIPYAAKMWRLFRIRAVAAARLNDTGAWFDYITFQYDGKHGPMRGEDMRQLELLLPHIAKAIEISRPMSLLEQRFSAVLDALDHFHVGVVILSESGSKVIANSEAQRILELTDGVQISSGGKFVAERESDQALLQQAIAKATKTVQQQGASDGTLLKIPRRSGKDDFLLEVVPLTDRTGSISPVFCGAMVFLIDPADPGEVSTGGMRKLYDLTLSEAEICRLLVDGHSNPQMADIRGVSPETIKSQLHTMLRKTRSPNRSALIRLALSINLPIDKPTAK